MDGLIFYKRKARGGSGVYSVTEEQRSDCEKATGLTGSREALILNMMKQPFCQINQ